MSVWMTMLSHIIKLLIASKFVDAGVFYRAFCWAWGWDRNEIPHNFSLAEDKVYIIMKHRKIQHENVFGLPSDLFYQLIQIDSYLSIWTDITYQTWCLVVLMWMFCYLQYVYINFFRGLVKIRTGTNQLFWCDGAYGWDFSLKNYSLYNGNKVNVTQSTLNTLGYKSLHVFNLICLIVEILG